MATAPLQPLEPPRNLPYMNMRSHPGEVLAWGDALSSDQTDRAVVEAGGRFAFNVPLVIGSDD